MRFPRIKSGVTTAYAVREVTWDKRPYHQEFRQS